MPRPQARALAITLRNDAGLRWVLPRSNEGWSLGTIELRSKPVEAEAQRGLLLLRNLATAEERWLAASEAEQIDECKAHLKGTAEIDGVTFSFEADVELASDIPAASLDWRWRVDRPLEGWEVCLSYHDRYIHPWRCHLYPFAEDARDVSQSPLTYVGIPAALLYREDFSLGLLFGMNPAFDYLNPNTWTGRTGFHFADQATPPQFRVGGGSLTADLAYLVPLQLLFSDAGTALSVITDLMRIWIQLNNFQVERLHVRTPDEALALFLQGRRHTQLWIPGVGYRLEEGDPESDFVYLGEQGLSAYFEYRIYELTGDPLWRRRCLEQMDFMLQAQDMDPSHRHYGAFHTAYDLNQQAFNSDDRGHNVGYKPDLNAHMARYMLLTWERFKMREGIDRQDWHRSAVLAADWVLRQANPDGGLPQRVDLATGERSVSVVSGRTLPALLALNRITGDSRYRTFAEQLEEHLRHGVEARLHFTGHHPDLPADEIEEASIWGAVEYWLDKHELAGKAHCLERALAEAYLALLWWCPKQLSWVSNPTQCASAEQQHFLQYSVYCYHNRKLECLRRLHKHTGEALFGALYSRVLQGVFWTQVTEGDTRGATHERIGDPWLMRGDYGRSADVNSLGTVYMSEQSLDTMLQLVEMGEVTLARDSTGSPDAKGKD
jgi:hypothetical protein